VASGAYERAIHAFAPGLAVVQRACPLFVPLVEEGWFDHPATRLVAEAYLADLRGARVRALVLGCTHYPLLKPLLQDVVGPDTTLIDSGEATASALEMVLCERGLQANGHGRSTHRFVVSDDEARFRQIGARILGDRLGAAEVVPLG